MDEVQFDTWTRALAAGRSRRQGLRVLVGAGAALLALVRPARRGASAHHAMLGPGDPCRDSSQCVGADAPLICADNGFALDGPLNCCTHVGSRCGFDQGCCGDAACIDGFCGSIQDYPGPGERCRDSSICVAADAPLTCDFVAVTGDYRCCTYEGSRCGFDAACCGAATCFNGFCANIAVDAGVDIVGPGDSCQYGYQCVAADTALTCDYVGQTDDFRCCAYEGSRCGFDAACCGAAACVNGYCANIAVDVGLDAAGPGDPCQDSSQCVAADTAVTCDYVGVTDDYRCCAYEGGRCGWDGGCCGWLRCGDDGFCTGLPPTGCNGEGCDCDFHDPNACAPGLVCCAVQSGFICATWADCGGA